MARMARPFFWWSEYGTFEADQSGRYPQVRQVVAHYRRLSGLSCEELAAKLGMSARAHYYAECEGRGLDSVLRLRELQTTLAIPPALLGLCNPPGAPGWWVQEYEPWASDKNGWPDVRAVVKRYRRAKSWTQSDLAVALGVTLQTVQNMELSGSSLDSITRRRALRFLLGIPPVLLGLDSEHIRNELGGTLIGQANGPSPELISSLRASVNTLFTGYYAGHAQDQVPNALALLQEVHSLALAQRGPQQRELLQIESLGYQGLANIERERGESNVVVFSYANAGVRLANASGNPDLRSAALCRRAETAFLLGHPDLGRQSMHEALSLPLNEYDAEHAARVAAAPRVLAVDIFDEEGRSEVRALIDQAMAKPLGGDDPFYRRCDREIVLIRSAEALNLLALQAPQAQAHALYKKAEALLLPLNPEKAGRSLMAKLALSQTFVGLNEPEGAATLALEALPLMDQRRNVVYLPQVAQIHTALRESTYRHSTQVAHLGLYLHERGVL